MKFKVLDAGNDIDIVVLVPPYPLLDKPLPSVPADSAGVTLGGDCEFLGFPYGGGWRGTYKNGNSRWFPFVKHCTVSSLAGPQDGIWVLDGINNAGFSGGPVLIRTGLDQKIFAVVSGYHTEPAEVIASAHGEKPPINPTHAAGAHANVNSGFLIAYDIRYAIDAIKKNPVGPLRQSN